MLKKGRRYAIVLAFVAAAVLTPPDIISQIGLALPTILLYEASIISVRLVERRRASEEAAREAAAEGGEPRRSSIACRPPIKRAVLPFRASGSACATSS